MEQNPTRTYMFKMSQTSINHVCLLKCCSYYPLADMGFFTIYVVIMKLMNPFYVCKVKICGRNCLTSPPERLHTQVDMKLVLDSEKLLSGSKNVYPKYECLNHFDQLISSYVCTQSQTSIYTQDNKKHTLSLYFTVCDTFTKCTLLILKMYL